MISFQVCSNINFSSINTLMHIELKNRLILKIVLMDISQYFSSLTFNITDIILVSVTGIAFLVSLYHFVYYYSIVKYTTDTKNDVFPPVSVIISAKNAALMLEDHLQYWLEQDYPTFEVVIIDDCSMDETAYFLVTQAEKEPLLRYVLLDPGVIKSGGKKLALTLGIKKARYSHFLLTDADCIPASNQWLRQMAQQFESKTEIVLGVSPVETGPGFLGKLVQYENVFTALNYLGMALRDKPFMGVGRNLAYMRKTYERVGGFSAHHHIPAGDDDLFVQSTSNAENTAVCIRPEAFVKTQGPRTFQQYWNQKMRHLWVGKYYLPEIKNRLAVFPVFQCVFWIGIISWFILGSSWLWPFALILIKVIPEWVIFYRKGILLEMPKSGSLYPIFNIFYTFWYLYIGINAFFKKKIIW